MKGRQGFTLMELLVVLLIIGILSTVALRTIDATRDRSLFDQTTTEMNKLVQAIVGNPDLTYDGRRVDFGYYGDMEEMPGELRDLVYTTGDPAWHGPYFKLMSVGDTVSYLYDGWARPYSYNPAGTIASTGNGKFPMTVKIVDDLAQLTDNVISGTITDIDGSPPGIQNISPFQVRMYYNNPTVHPAPAEVTPLPGGYYKFALSDPAWPRWEVPIGIHKLVVLTGTDSLVRHVTVLPRSKTIVDFKFAYSFWGKLRMVDTVRHTLDGKGFLIKVVNDGTEDATVNWLAFLPTSESLYMRDFYIGSDHCGTPLPTPGPLGYGPGARDTVYFTPPGVTIAPNGLVDLYFNEFHVDPNGNDPSVVVTGMEFKFRFSDQSLITVRP